MQEFIAYTKANHAKMQFGSGGVGLRRASQLRARQCRHRRRSHAYPLSRFGAGDAGSVRRPDRLLLCARRGRGRPLESKQAKAIAILTRDRSPLFPGLRSAHEQGLAGFPRRFLDRPVPAQGHARADRAEAEPGVAGDAEHPRCRSGCLKIAVTVVAARSPLAGLPKSFVESETKKWEGMIKASGVEPQ